VQVRQYTKGSSEITIFHSFARSNYFVQLKYRFSPPSSRLPRARLSQRRPLSATLPHLPSPSPPAATLRLLRPTSRSTLPCRPPYANIDRAQAPLPSLPPPSPRRRFFSFSPSRYAAQPPLSLPLVLLSAPSSFRFFLSFPFSRSCRSYRRSSLLSSVCHSGSDIQLLATRVFAEHSREKREKPSRSRYRRARKRSRAFRWPPARPKPRRPRKAR